jgi:hypothetical protein
MEARGVARNHDPRGGILHDCWVLRFNRFFLKRIATFAQGTKIESITYS